VQATSDSSPRRHFVERERETRRAIAAGDRDVLAKHTDESFRADDVRFWNAGGAVVQVLMRSDFFATEAFFCDHGRHPFLEKDIPIPVLKPEQPKGGLDIEFDPDGNIWLSMMYQAGIAKIDRRTHEVTVYPFPKEWQSPSTQASMVSPTYMNVDGKVWTNNQEDHYSYRLDVKTGQWENMGQARDPNGKRIRAYGMPTDQQNNVYQLEFGGANIGRRNAKTGEVAIWPTPSANSRPRRGRVDDQNQLSAADAHDADAEHPSYARFRHRNS
jgi:hypothetical protein